MTMLREVSEGSLPPLDRFAEVSTVLGRKQLAGVLQPFTTVTDAIHSIPVKLKLLSSVLALFSYSMV